MKFGGILWLKLVDSRLSKLVHTAGQLIVFFTFEFIEFSVLLRILFTRCFKKALGVQKTEHSYSQLGKMHILKGKS